MENVWTWSGKYFGYISNGILFTHKGKSAGKLQNNNIFDRQGRYLGEVINKCRLRTHKKFKDFKGPACPDVIGSPYALPNLPEYAEDSAFEDFPSPETF